MQMCRRVGETGGRYETDCCSHGIGHGAPSAIARARKQHKLLEQFRVGQAVGTFLWVERSRERCDFGVVRDCAGCVAQETPLPDPPKRGPDETVQTAPLLQYYCDRGICRCVDASAKREDVTRQIVAVMESAMEPRPQSRARTQHKLLEQFRVGQAVGTFLWVDKKSRAMWLWCCPGLCGLRRAGDPFAGPDRKEGPTKQSVAVGKDVRIVRTSNRVRRFGCRN